MIFFGSQETLVESQGLSRKVRIKEQVVIRDFFLFLFLNWDSLHARINSHYEAWGSKKMKHKKIKAYR